jgi:hypothetical protein
MIFRGTLPGPCSVLRQVSILPSTQAVVLPLFGWREREAEEPEGGEHFGLGRWC